MARLLRTTRPRRLPPYPLGTPSVVLSGTITSAVKADIVAGGKTIILTLTGDSYVAAGSTFDAQRQSLINNLTSAQSETNGWNNVVKAGMAVTDVVRTSSSVVTVTLEAFATYNITAPETITATVPPGMVLLGNSLVASPTFTITLGATSVVFRKTLSGVGSRVGSRQVHGWA